MKKQVLIDFGKQVRKERLKQKLSQEELADRAGLHRTYIGMVERAEKNVTLESIQKITKALGLKIADLLKTINE